MELCTELVVSVNEVYVIVGAVSRISTLPIVTESTTMLFDTSIMLLAAHSS